jgi:hypothetical protein
MLVLVPVPKEQLETVQEELKTAIAMASLRDGWRLARKSGVEGLSLEEINEEISEDRLARRASGNRPPRTSLKGTP